MANPTEYDSPPRNIFEALKIQRTLWLATFVAPILLYGALIFAFHRQGDQPVTMQGDMLTAYYVFLGIAVVATLVLPVASLRIPELVLRRHDAADNPFGASTVALILSCVTCEFASLSWSAVMLLTRDPRYALGMVLPALVMLRHWPTAERISELIRHLGRKA